MVLYSCLMNLFAFLITTMCQADNFIALAIATPSLLSWLARAGSGSVIWYVNSVSFFSLLNCVAFFYIDCPLPFFHLFQYCNDLLQCFAIIFHFSYPAELSVVSNLVTCDSLFQTVCEQYSLQPRHLWGLIQDYPPPNRCITTSRCMHTAPPPLSLKPFALLFLYSYD